MDLLGELQRAEFKEAFDEFDKVNPKSCIPSTLNIGLIQWQTQMIVCAVKC